MTEVGRLRDDGFKVSQESCRGVRNEQSGSSFGSSFMRAGVSVELVEREHSHFFLWVGCVEELTEVFWNVPAHQRERTVFVLGAVWRLLPGNRLREVRICLLRF